MIHLKNHAAFVTGSTQGVGLAIATCFAKSGAKVTLHGLRKEDPSSLEAIQICSQIDPQTKMIDGDLSGFEVDESGERLGIENAVQSVFEKAIDANPEMDILVCNAGTYIDQPFLEMDFETFDKTMKLNVYSYFLLTQKFARHWVQQKISGRVLLIGSINGRLAEPDHAAYDTSKGAVEMMVKTLCVSLAPHGIRVNGLAPGLFETPLTAPALSESKLRTWMQQHTPNGQIPGAEVCAEAALYLVSDSAKHVTGQMLLVDGGMSAWQQPDP